MGARWALNIVNGSGGELSAGLTLVLHAFPASRIFLVALDDRRIAAIRCATEPADYHLELVGLVPGRHRLELRPATPATVADDVLHNGDRRRPSFAFWDWRWDRD